MQIIPYHDDVTTTTDGGGETRGRHTYYDPHHVNSSCTYTLEPGQTILVTLDRHHAALEHVVQRVMVGNKTLTCRYAALDQLGLLITNRSTWLSLTIPKGTPLNVLLNVKPIHSHWVTFPPEDTTTTTTTTTQDPSKAAAAADHSSSPSPSSIRIPLEQQQQQQQQYCFVIDDKL